MAISKLILNGETQMDVTSNTNTSNNMLSGVIGTKNDGTSVTGSIASKSSSDLTVSGATVTAPAGYYANAASKAVSTTTHPNPSASIASSTGVVTASHTQGTGYVTGGTTTGTLNLTTQAGKIVTPTETAQTAVASYRWTTGPVSVAAISSTYVGTGITTRSAADLTASGSIVTAPAGYYSTAATKAVAAGSAFPPAVTITKAPTIGVNTSGVVTASYNGSSSITPTVTSGYVSQGTAGTISTTGTSTYQLTSKAAATYYPSTADQTIASQRWLVGNQTIKSVTTSNLTAENIAEGVVVQVGDSSNASRITQVTGTHSGATSYTATICGWSGTNGNANYCYVMYGGVKKYTIGDTFTFKAGDTLTIYDRGNEIYINGLGVETSNYTYTYILPDNDTDIHMYYDNSTECCVSVKNKIPEDNIIFRSHWDNASQSDVYTCNKTYDECYALFESGRGAHAYYEQTTSIDFFLTGVVKRDGLRFRCYEGETGDAARDELYYYPDNTIIYTYNPYHTIAFINITSNGTYSSASTYYHEINVNVQGSGYTADDIAMRTITGDISGSATTIGSYAFYYCSALTTASFPSATCIDTYAFAFCSSLTTVSFPSATSIGYSTFYSCSALTTASFPNVTSVGNYAFYYCRSLTTTSFPKATYIGMYAFNYCTKLTTASFPNVTSIGNYAFRSCYNLLSLYLLGSSIPTLASTTAFSSTPISTYTTSTGGVYGSIFVPSSLYSSYLTATNWSVYSNRIVSV